MHLVNKDWKTQLNFLWIGQALIMAMLGMSLPYWPLYIAQFSDFSPIEIRFWSAAIYVAPFLTSIFCAPLWGKIGDRFGYKPMVIRACLGLLITQALILFFHDVFLIFLFRLLQGLLAGFTVAAQAWSLAISPTNHRGATLGKLQSATAIGDLTGPLLGGLIASFAGYQAIFSGATFICAFVTLFFFFFLKDANPSSQGKNKVKTKRKGSLKLTFQQTVVMILVTIVIVQLVMQMITPVFALFVTEALGGNDIMVGILYAAPGVMIFLTASYWGKFFDKMTQTGYPLHYVVSFLLLTSACLQLFHAYSDTVSAVFVLRMLWGICLGALLPILLRLLIANTTDNNKGTILGWGASATKLGNVLGIMLGAFLEAYLGYANSFLMMALFYLISSVITFVYLRSEPLFVK